MGLSNDGNSNENVAKGQKAEGWFRLAKQQLCTYITLFCTFLCRRCTLHDYDVKMPNFTFCEGHEHKPTTFFFWLEHPGKFANI